MVGGEAGLAILDTVQYSTVQYSTGVTLYRTQLTTAAQGHVKYEPSSAGTVLTTWRIRHTFPHLAST